MRADIASPMRAIRPAGFLDAYADPQASSTAVDIGGFFSGVVLTILLPQTILSLHSGYAAFVGFGIIALLGLSLGLANYARSQNPFPFVFDRAWDFPAFRRNTDDDFPHARRFNDELAAMRELRRGRADSALKNRANPKLNFPESQ